MTVMYSSKNVPLTGGLRTFIERKLAKFAKFTKHKNSDIHVMLDVEHKRRGANPDAVVELSGKIGDKPVVIRETGKTFYEAFFGATARLKEKFTKEHVARRRQKTY